MHTYGYKTVAEYKGGQLVLGPFLIDQEDLDIIKREQIDVVVNLCETSEYHPGQRELVQAELAEAGITEQRFPLVDLGGFKEGMLDTVSDSIIDLLSQGRRVYLHCRAGRERSGSVAVVVIAKTERVSGSEALERLQLRKTNAIPLSHQLAQV